MSPKTESIHEQAFLALSESWKSDYSRLGKFEIPSRDTDLDLLAAMLIAVEHSARLSMRSFHATQECINLSSTRMYPWIDRLPWDIACDCMATSLRLGYEHTLDYGVVSDKLEESQSALRMWAMEISWFVRHKLTADETLPKLFENVAATIAHTTPSWGLAATFFADMESFHLAADEYEAEDFEDQYENRKQFYKKIRPVNWQAHFWKLESELRRRIQQTIEGPSQTLISL